MRPAMFSSLPSLTSADAQPDRSATRPGLVRRALAVTKAAVEVWNEASELRRTLRRRYPFPDF